MDKDLYPLMRQIEDQHWWFTARREILSSLLERQNLPADVNVLEVGCGTGGNIAMLQKFGPVTCVEYDDSAAELARERQLAEVLPGALPNQLPAFDRAFGLITVFDVIEHVEEDAASLQALAGLLAPGGRIVVTVPAFNFLWSRHDDENQHKRRYRAGDLTRLAHEANLNLHYISYFNTILFPPVAAVRLIRKVLPYEESWQDMQMPGPLVNRLLASVFRSERHLVGRVSLPFGISLAAVLGHAESA